MMRRKSIRYKLLIQAAIAGSCLFEAVGCPQVFANAFKDGTRTFLESGLPTALLEALDFEQLLFGSDQTDG